MSALRRWQDQLAAWALPEWLLDQAEESPYGWPQFLWRRRSEMAEGEGESPTFRIAGDMLGEGGVLLDVGAGRGRVSLPLARQGHRLVAVEPDAAMAAGFREDAAARQVEATLIEGRWPQVADQVGPVDVALSAHVVYDVSDIVPFLSAMSKVARSGVVLEISETHPWAEMARLYREVHGLERPSGPTAGDLADVIREELGVVAEVERWERTGHVWFADWDEIVEFYGRRLVLPSGERAARLRPLLEPLVVEAEGRLTVGDDRRRLVTLWWRTRPST